MTSFANNFLWSCCRHNSVGQLSAQFPASRKNTNV